MQYTLKLTLGITFQVMLEAGEACSLWLDIDRRFIAQTKLNLSQFLELAKTGGSNGVVGWPSGKFQLL